MGRSGRVAAIVAGLALTAGLTGCNPRATAPVRAVERAVVRASRPAPTTTTTAATATVRQVRSTTTTTIKRSSSGGGGGGSSRPKPTTTSTTAAPTTTVAPTTTTSTTSTTAAPAPGGLLWRSSYDGATTARDVWQSEQEAASDRIQLVDGAHGRVMRVQLEPGDVVSGGNRAEVYGRHASPRTTPAAQWPDPIGSTRWYGFDLYIPNDFVTDPTGLVWFTFTQWKGVEGGSPALALEIKRDRIELAGSSARNDLGAIKRGQWERIVVGVHLDPTSDGWVEAYRDGAQALPRTARPTMGYYAGEPDAIYLKQGIYRSAAWAVSHTLEFGPMSIGQSKADVL